MALLELTFLVFVIVALILTAASLLQTQASTVRVLYEEQVAHEAVSSLMERLEAGRVEEPAVGRTPVDVNLPGWENLHRAACAWIVESGGDGILRVRIEAAWTAFDGRERRVELRTRRRSR